LVAIETKKNNKSTVEFVSTHLCIGLVQFQLRRRVQGTTRRNRELLGVEARQSEHSAWPFILEHLLPTSTAKMFAESEIGKMSSL